MNRETGAGEEAGPGAEPAICLVARLYWPEGGGAATVLRRMVSTWAASGHRVTVLTTRSRDHLPPREEDGGATIVRLPVSRLKFLGTARFIRQVGSWLRQHRPTYDVVCVSMLKHAAFTAVRARRDTGAPVVLRTEGGGATGDVQWQKDAFLGGKVRSACARADAIVAIHGPIHRELLEAGYAEETIVDLPNAVPVPSDPWRAEAVPEERLSLGLNDVPTLCYTGRFREQKGLEDLVEAFAIVRGELTRGQLVLVGEGPDRLRLEGIAANLGVGEHIRFPGQVGDVMPYLRASDVFVLPSYIEGMSISLLEALSLGMPSVATDIDANRGLLPEDMLPLVPVKRPDRLAGEVLQAMAPEARSPERLARIRGRVRDVYGMESVAGRYLDLFRRLIARA